MITKDQIIEILNRDDIEIFFPNKNPLNFNRLIEFKIRGQNYTIEWWANVCYLYIGDRDFGNPKIEFKLMEYTTTHPCFKNGLAFGSEYTSFPKRVNAYFWIPITKNNN